MYKTQVVKPMVGGHIIQRPVIHLPRINLGDLEAAVNIYSQRTDNVSSLRNEVNDNVNKFPFEYFDNVLYIF